MKRVGPLLSWLLLLCPSPCAATIDVSLPLQGYYRPGRYMPVRVVVAGESPTELTLSADGAVTTLLPLVGGVPDAIVPMLVVREPLGPVKWSTPDGRAGTVAVPLKALGEQDRLVGYAGGAAGADTGADAALFPGRAVVRVALDVADPLRWPTEAWESLDAAVIDVIAPRSITPANLAAGGTSVVVRSGVAPEADVRSWRRVGGAWVMDGDATGPRGPIVPEAYDLTYGWKPGRHPVVRRQVALIGLLLAILVLAATLWRSRWAVAAVVGLCAAATGALMFRASRQSPVVAARGTVLVRQGAAARSDLWEFYKTMAPAVASNQPRTMSRPVFASPAHFERCGITLLCRPDGEPSVWTFPLTPRAAMVFLTRRPAFRSEEAVDPAAGGSPLWPLVRQTYLRRDVRAAGEVAGAPGDDPSAAQEVWPGVVVDASAR